MNDALHPCFGFEIFGLCNYDPSGPASTYFSVGDAIAALAFTLAVQQFLKPIFIFRLNARGISLFWLYGLVFCGFLSAMIAAVLPSLPIDRELPFAYPIVWEIIGASLFAISYGLLAFGSIWPLRIKEGQVPKFVKAAAGYLAEREEKDYVDLGREILRNLPELMNKASFIDHRWQRISAFYQFTHRKKIEDAAYASSLLRIMSDSRFCRTLIDGCPWLVDSTIRTIAEKQMTTSSAERFIQEISVQALQSDSGILAREMGYQGFSHAPVLSESLFSNFHILQTFRPLSWLNLRNDQPLERGYLQRLGAACEASYKTTINAREYWEVHHLHDLTEVYEDVFRELNRHHKNENRDFRLILEATQAVENVVEQVRTHLSVMDHDVRNALYADDGDPRSRFQLDIIDTAANLVCKCFFAVSNNFTGIDDPFWHFAIGLWMKLFPFHKNEAVGMDPLQQRVAILLREKIRDNMNGYYPAVLKIILAVSGPYRSSVRINRTA